MPDAQKIAEAEMPCVCDAAFSDRGRIDPHCRCDARDGLIERLREDGLIVEGDSRAQHEINFPDGDDPSLRLYTLSDAAEVLGVSRTTVHRLIADGHLAPVEVPSGRRYLARAELQRFVEDRTVR